MAGLRIVQANLAREIRAIKARTVEGVYDAADYVGDLTVPYTPIRYGVLRASRVVSTNGDPENPLAAIAFTDPKAPLVHEMNLRYHVGGWKFLEIPLDRSHQEILQRIHAKVRIR